MADFNHQELLHIPTTTSAPAAATTITNKNNLEDEPVDFTLLRLDNSTTNNNHHHYHTPCATCGCSGAPSSNKRGSPEINTQDQVTKKPKKLFLDPPETTTTAPIAPSLTSTLSGRAQERALRRCFSDPCSPPAATTNLVPESPQDSSKKGSASLPPKHPLTLTRSLSDASPNKSYSRSSSFSGSPTFKWLKKMKDSMREITRMWDEIMLDDQEPALCDFEDDEKGTEENTANDAMKSDAVTDCEEAVCVEKTGECLIVNFKCPCGKRYQILLSGGNCYYKLM